MVNKISTRTVTMSGVVQSVNVILFDQASTFLQSDIITVRAGQPVMLVGYMVPDGAEFVVESASIGSRKLSEDYTHLSHSSAADVLFREPMVLGGNRWVINAANRHLVITLPGTYVLSLNSDEHLGSIHVEKVELGVMSAEIPARYCAGVIVNADATSVDTADADEQGEEE